MALGLSACGREVIALGPLGAWRHALRKAKIVATEFSLPGDERKFTQAIHDHEPQVIHAFGAETAHLVLPMTLLVGAGGVATLGHADLTHINPTHFRTASTIFTPCEHLREQIGRRLPAIPVITTGYLLPPAGSATAARNRFLAEELGVEDGVPVVLLADSFHGSETDAALALIEATPRITERVPGLQVVIAGKGLRLGELEGLAIEVNERLGRRAVLLPGQRDDIAQLLQLATVAVGSGRFAMEAAGAGVALVAAGAAGMVGTFTEETAQVVHFTCAGRHGHLEPVTPKALAAEIIGLFNYPLYRERFAGHGQTLLLNVAERKARAAQIAVYYDRTAPSGAVNRMPQQLCIILPEELRELLFALPALNGLREHFPLAHFHLVATPRHRRLLESLAFSERVSTRPQYWHEWQPFLRTLTRPRAEVCMTFAGDLYSTLLAACSLAPSRLGFAEGAGAMLLSDHLAARTPVSPARAVTLAHALGIAQGSVPDHPGIPAEAAAQADRLLTAAGVASGRGILLCRAADETLAWPRGHWEALTRTLAEQYPGEVLVAGAEDAALPVGAGHLPAFDDSLLLAAVCVRVRLVIAADAGALHLADLLGVPTLGLFGPTSPDVCTLPNTAGMRLCHREFPCHPCGEAPCEERHCLLAITPAEVADAVGALLHAPVAAE